MEQDYIEAKERDEVGKYQKRLMFGVLTFVIIGLMLNVAAALVSHIAMWQVLVWLSLSCVILAILCWLSYIWISK